MDGRSGRGIIKDEEMKGMHDRKVGNWGKGCMVGIWDGGC
jgi:hypothetical protein